MAGTKAVLPPPKNKNPTTQRHSMLSKNLPTHGKTHVLKSIFIVCARTVMSNNGYKEPMNYGNWLQAYEKEKEKEKMEEGEA